jgi:hypothetical protein
MIENFINTKLKHYWEMGAPLTREQLQFLVQQEVAGSDDACAVKMFVTGKCNTLQKFIARTQKKTSGLSKKLPYLRAYRLIGEQNKRRTPQGVATNFQQKMLT